MSEGRESFEQIGMESELGKPRFQYDVIFLRHGDRAGIEDALTEIGREQSREYGRNVVFEKLAGRASSTQRTKDTIEEIYSTAPSETKFNIRTKQPLHYENYFSEDYLRKIRQMFKEGRREDAGLYHLSFENMRPDPNTTSPRETAASVAKLLKHYLEMAKHFKENTKLGLVNISHDLVLAPFIAEILRKIKQKEGLQMSMKEAIVSTGGALRPLEEIRFSLAGNEKKTLTLHFRGSKYEVAPQLIEEIVAYESPEE